MTPPANPTQSIRNQHEAASGLDAVAEERYRQLDELGYDARHDDTHDQGEIAIAAAKILFEHTDGPGCVDDEDVPEDWDDALALKMRQADPMTRLTVAGALVVAEIDRLRRAAGLPVNYDKAGQCEVGHNDRDEVIVQFPSFLRWVAFTPQQAETFAGILRARARSVQTSAAPGAVRSIEQSVAILISELRTLAAAIRAGHDAAGVPQQLDVWADGMETMLELAEAR